MRKIALAASATMLALTVTVACAQTAAQSGPQNPAVKMDTTNNSDIPVKGANSFTMSEAQSRIMDKGYTHVSGMKKDSDGVWRGMASKDGQRVHVSVDFQGNVDAS